MRCIAFVPAGETTGAGLGAQGWQWAKCAPALAKMQLSTRLAALYYYDYVFIKDIRRRQRTTGATRTAGVHGGGTRMPRVPDPGMRRARGACSALPSPSIVAPVAQKAIF